MGELLQSLDTIIKESRLDAIVLEGAGERIIEELGARYAHGIEGGELWERLDSSFGHQDPEAWRWISEYVSGRPCIMVFPALVESGAVKLANGSDLVTILAGCDGFEFYVTDANYSFLLCFNHHDFLVAAGEAKNLGTPSAARK